MPTQNYCSFAAEETNIFFWWNDLLKDCTLFNKRASDVDLMIYFRRMFMPINFPTYSYVHCWIFADCWICLQISLFWWSTTQTFHKGNKKAFQSKANRPLANRFGAGRGWGPQVNKFEHVLSTPTPRTNRHKRVHDPPPTTFTGGNEKFFQIYRYNSYIKWSRVKT